MQKTVKEKLFDRLKYMKLIDISHNIFLNCSIYSCFCI